MTGAGALDQRVRIDKPTRNDDGQGGAALTWSEHATVWAAIRPLRATESERQGAVRAVNVHMFTIRRRMDISADMKLVWTGEDFNIREVRRPRSHEQFLEIIAEQGVTQ